MSSETTGAPIVVASERVTFELSALVTVDVAARTRNVGSRDEALREITSDIATVARVALARLPHAVNVAPDTLTVRQVPNRELKYLAVTLPDYLWVAVESAIMEAGRAVLAGRDIASDAPRATWPERARRLASARNAIVDAREARDA